MGYLPPADCLVAFRDGGAGGRVAELWCAAEQACANACVAFGIILDAEASVGMSKALFVPRGKPISASLRFFMTGTGRTAPRQL